MLHPADLASISQQIQAAIKDELSQYISSLVREEIQECLQDTIQPLQNEIEKLKLENSHLKSDIDALEQYGRRELIRVNGVQETADENTTDIVKI